MDLSLQLQVEEQDLEEFPEITENLSPNPEDSYPTFKPRRKKKRKNPNRRNKKAPQTPKTQEAIKINKIPCLLDLKTSPTPALVYALSRRRRGFGVGHTRGSIRHFHTKGSIRYFGRRRQGSDDAGGRPEESAGKPGRANETYDKAGRETGQSYGRNGQAHHDHRQKPRKDGVGERSSSNRRRREGKARDSQKKTNTTTSFQRREGRMTRSSPPQSRRLDGGNRNQNQGRQNDKFQANSGPSGQRMVQPNRKEKDVMGQSHNRTQPLFFYSRKVPEKSTLPVEQIQVQPSDRRHRGVHQKCSRVRSPARLH